MKKALFSLLICVHLLPNSSSAQQPEPIAVIAFEGIGISQDVSKALTNRFRDELVKANKYRVIERGKMEEILQEQAFQQTGCTSDECAVEIGKLLSVQQIILGSISKVGKLSSVSIRIVSVETGEITKSINYDHGGEIDGLLTRGMKNVVLELLGKPQRARYVTTVSQTKGVVMIEARSPINNSIITGIPIFYTSVGEILPFDEARTALGKKLANNPTDYDLRKELESLMENRSHYPYYKLLGTTSKMYPLVVRMNPGQYNYRAPGGSSFKDYYDTFEISENDTTNVSLIFELRRN